MKKGRIYTLVNSIVIAGTMLISNPDKHTHAEAFHDYSGFEITEDDYDFRWMVPVEKVDYGLFSLTRITYSYTRVKGVETPNKRTIGIGLFGGVWIYEDPRKS